MPSNSLFDVDPDTPNWATSSSASALGWGRPPPTCVPNSKDIDKHLCVLSEQPSEEIYNSRTGSTGGRMPYMSLHDGSTLD